MKLLRDNIRAMQGYQPGEQPPPGARVIKLNTNENPYPPSPRVVEAIRRELDAGTAPGEGLRLYSDPAATAFRQAAAAAVDLPVDTVLCGNGSDELLSLLFRAFVAEGETVAYPYPTYVLYETLAQAQAAQIRTWDFDEDYALPRGLFGCPAKLVLVASPNSPSGTFYDPARLRELAESLPQGVLVVDEAYIAFADRPGAVGLVSELPNVAVIRTLSKGHSLAGMRLGMLYAQPHIVAGLWKVKDSYNLDRLAIAAGEAALGDAAWTEANVARVRATRSRLATELAALGLTVLPSQANFVLARFPSSAQASATFNHLRDSGILARYFPTRLLDNALRITVGTDEQIDALMAAIRDHLTV